MATLACGQASKQAWPNSCRGQCRSRMRRADPSARQTRQPDLRQSIRLMQSATHTARLPVSRPAWMTYRKGLAMARRGYLTLASSRPSQLAGFLNSRWWSRSRRVQRVQVIFGSRQLQPDQPVERAYKLILAAGCPLSTFGAGNLLSFFWHRSAGSGRAWVRPCRFLRGTPRLSEVCCR